MLKKIQNKLQSINLLDLSKKVGIALLKAQFGWTIAYFLSLKSFGTAYCAPGWMRLFQDEKPPTILDALQNTDITLGKIIFLSIAGYALFKGVEYGVKMGIVFCKGVWEGYTGKDSSLTAEEKIDYLYNNVNVLNRKLDNLQDTIMRINQHHVEQGFNGIFDELADIKNGGESLKRVLNDMRNSLSALSQDSSIDFTAQEINRLAQQLEQIRVTLLNTNSSLNPSMDDMLSRIEGVAQNLEDRSREELGQISAELRTNMGHIRHIVEQNTSILSNPILNEEIIVPNSTVQTSERHMSSEAPTHTIHHGSRRMDTQVNDTPIVSSVESDIHQPRTLSTENHLVINGLEPGTYTLEITNQGGLHIDPVVQQNISAVANQATNPNSTAHTILSGLAGLALHPEVQNAAVSYGTRIFTQSQQQQPVMPQMPYYPPMVPYGYGGLPNQPSTDVSDILAHKGGELAHGAIKVIGRTGGALLKGFFGLV